MRLNELRLENLRNIRELLFQPDPGVNLLTGPNGAGKTSVLEGIYLLSHARSFRTRRSEFLLRNGADRLTVFGSVVRKAAPVRLGLLQEAGAWAGRVDGRPPASLAALLEHCAVVCFEPGSHALISGASDERRRFIDWGVFHVEHDFSAVAKRYRRALRQRNAALREGLADQQLSVWDDELARAAEPLAGARKRYLDRLRPRLVELLADYLPDLGAVDLRYRPGWDQDRDLATVLAEVHAIDRQRGHTTRGPHRADWILTFPGAPRREQLSRGQEKLCAIACMLAQAGLYQNDHGEWPIVVLDDLPSELDQPHLDAALRSLSPTAQVFLSSTDIPDALGRTGIDFRRFHVEQGVLRS